MRATTVRFADDLWTLLEGEASAQQVSAAQFVRDATLLRLATVAARRGDLAAQLTIEDVARGALRAGARGEPPPGVADPDRLAALRASGALDLRSHPGLERLTELARRLLDAPVSLVSLVEGHRQVFASCPGLAEPWASRSETPLSHSFCQYAVSRREPVVVPDAREDPVLRDNLAIRDLDVIAYLGAPLIDPRGHALGAFCVIDSRPRAWSADQVRIVADLAESAMSEILLVEAGLRAA